MPKPSPSRKVAPAQPKPPELLTIALAQIEPDPVQLRRHFDQAALAELAESIKASGLLQPITVKVWGGLDRYRIISGERRYRASQLAGGAQSQSDRVELLLRPDEQTIQRFIADFTVPRDGDRTKCDWLHAEYGKWCAQVALQAQSEAEFSRVMGLLGFTKHRFASGRHYMNIGPKQVDA